ncbi:MAG: hypothetical protein HY000_09185 [Planctomycetes bacterium]|nr:hypothetical protein [Planctomycetota bacterium]
MGVLLLAIILQDATKPVQGPPAQLTKEQLIAGFTEYREQFRTLFVRFRCDLGGKQPATNEVTFAQDGDRRYSGVHARLGELESRFWSAFNGERSKTLHIADHAGTVELGKAEQAEKHEMFLRALHIPRAETDLAAANDPEPDPPFWLPEGIKQERYVVLPHQELVDGYWTHVVAARDRDSKDPKASYATFWIAPEQGFVLVRSERHQGQRPDLLMRERLLDYQSAGPCLVPRTIISEEFNPRLGPGSAPARVSRLDVEEILVGDVPQEVFDPIFPPGTRVLDLISGASYTIPGDWTENIDLLPQEAKRKLRDFQYRMEHGAWYQRATVWWMAGSLLLAVGLIAAWRLWRRS